MKTVRGFVIDSLALALLAGCIGSGPAKAQGAAGQFRLPVEAHWNGITLPPGDYSFHFTKALGAMAVTRGDKQVAWVLAQSVGPWEFSQSSVLLEQSGGVTTLRELRLANADLVLHYGPPKTGKVVEVRLLVPITTQGASIKRDAPVAPQDTPARSHPGTTVR
jgi:hypothetical protein